MVYFEIHSLYDSSATNIVSILVLMDGVLRESEVPKLLPYMFGFNPCSNGWCTSRPPELSLPEQTYMVSILVLMDGVLRDLLQNICQRSADVSILVLMDGVLRETTPPI